MMAQQQRAQCPSAGAPGRKPSSAASIAVFTRCASSTSCISSRTRRASTSGAEASPTSVNAFADFSPITGSFHRPPPVHQVFEAPGCVVCNFVPRMLDYDQRAMPIPSFHSNVDSDEIIFYAEGNFFSRKGSGIRRGSISVHPAGHIYGPHPGAWESGPSRVGQRTEEIAVMLDTFKPLGLAAKAGNFPAP